MQLVEQTDEGLHLVRGFGVGTVQVGDRVFSNSLLLMPERYVEAFPARELADFTPEIITAVLALQPALVLIGTGPRQFLPTPALMAGFLRHGVGLEAMDSHAAARTYNLLASEGRRVAVVFLL